MTRMLEDGATGGSGGEDTERIMVSVGRLVRQRRKDRGLTLNQLAQRTGVSASMLSMLERGLSSASVGTLVAVASALGTSMADLFESPPEPARSPVVRKSEQPTIATPHGATRRIVHRDDGYGLEIAVNDYEHGGSSGEFATHHSGVEVGVVISGQLRVEIESQVYDLSAGDAIEYLSSRPHRISSVDCDRASAVWVNIQRRESAADPPSGC